MTLKATTRLFFPHSECTTMSQQHPNSPTITITTTPPAAAPQKTWTICRFAASNSRPPANWPLVAAGPAVWRTRPIWPIAQLAQRRRERSEGKPGKTTGHTGTRSSVLQGNPNRHLLLGLPGFEVGRYKSGLDLQRHPRASEPHRRSLLWRS
ncbi:hypothetical protein EJ06DRAFT_31367 [Trichodelitschia bisporula]|uniref:Uncharacterized protein n=1 Tax=Trichodelitschia bisporula TaxID=703511 RepID=A0A6G1IBE9_9PEZI|nr:hypothetical protein EJ06DRAFT_31367 [Trichodelitschia bisporula]